MFTNILEWDALSLSDIFDNKLIYPWMEAFCSLCDPYREGVDAIDLNQITGWWLRKAIVVNVAPGGYQVITGKYGALPEHLTLLRRMDKQTSCSVV